MPERVGRFRIERPLGAGGMGVVYAAIDERLGRRVALKILRPEVSQDDEQRRRLLWDARAASALTHPNIVCVYEAGEDGGTDYVAMELVPGSTLAEVIARDTVERATMLTYAVQIASALEAAHAAGLVHRDLKPGNVMITSEGVAKLLDFGMAKSVTGIPDTNAPSTIEGRVAGTVPYMSPEQAGGEAIDARSDIFSFGSMFYEMLTSRRAFSGTSSVSVLARILHTDPEPPLALQPSLDSRLVEILSRCLRKDRERRFQSAGEIRVRLQEIIDDNDVVMSSRRRFARYAAIAAGAIAILGFGWAAYVVIPQRSGQPTTTLTRLTWDGGLSTAPAISQDGTLLAYASDRAGRGDLDIWLQRTGGDSIRLTSHPADDTAAALSPDGTQIAFRSERDGGGVYLIPSLGGNERLLVPGCRDPKYSPDGMSIACWMGEIGGAFFPGTAHIVIVASTGGQPRRFRPDFTNAALPLWTPDGRIVFLGRKTIPGAGSIVDWWIAPDATDGERPMGARALWRDQRLTPPEGQYYIRPEAWLEGGRRIVFTAQQNDATNLWSLTMEPDGTLRGPSTALTLGAAVQAFAATPATSTDGPLVFASLDVDMQLRRLPIRGSSLAPEPLLPNLSQVGSPSITDDGARLVFSARHGQGYRVVAVDIATAQQQTIVTPPDHRFVRALVSGNGERIVYNSGVAAYLIPVAGGSSKEICARCGWPTDVDAEGRQVLFEAAASDIAEQHLLLWANDRMQPLIAGADPKGRRQFAGRFSPDARWVAFGAVASDASTREILVVPNVPHRELGPDEWVAVTDGPAMDREPAWAPDGRTIYFLSDRDGFRCIWSRPFEPATGRPAGPVVPVAHFHHARELLRALTGSTGAIGLSASRDHLVFTVARTTGNVWRQTVPSPQ